jgi:hypothetical protein
MVRHGVNVRQPGEVDPGAARAITVTVDDGAVDVWIFRVLGVFRGSGDCERCDEHRQ